MSFVKLSHLLNDTRPPDYVVAIQSGKIINFEQFQRDVSAFRAPEKPCRVALFIEDSYEFTVGFYALLLAGCSIVFLPSIESQILSKFKNTFDCLITQLNQENNGANHQTNLQINAERDSLYFYTSGSTGEPKCIVKSLGMIERETAALDKTWGSDADAFVSIVYTTVPHYHFYGFIFKLMWPLASGRPFSTITYGPWEDLLEVLTPQATIISSPAHLRRIAGLHPLKDSQIPLRIFSAGAPLTYEVAQEARKILGVAPTEIFGSTETGVVATRSLEKSNDDVWHLLPDVSILSDDLGVMSVKSPYTSPEWIETSDLITQKENGFLFLGRADSIVKIEGKRVSLLEVEANLNSIDLVKEAIVISLSGERLAALVVLNQKGISELQSKGRFRLGRFLRESMSANGTSISGLPKLWRFLENIPVLETGKRDMKSIISMFEGDS